MAGSTAYAESQHYVVSHGVRLAVFDSPGEGPPLLFVHGYPDTHTVWDAVRAELAGRFHTVRYDVRGAGSSGAPRKLREYRLDRLADDLFAVADAFSPDRPVHLVAHDWGSIQSWQAATDPRAEDRLASFTTISGPCLDHTAYWFRERLRRPSPHAVAQLLDQAAKSWYIYAFHVPLAAPALWHFRLARNWGEMLREAEGVEPGPGRPQPTLEADGVRGMNLYRANMIRKLARPEYRFAKVPVQIISPSEDRFVSPALAEGLERWAPRLRRETVECGHWGALTRRAPEVARLVSAFAAEAERG